MRSPPMLEGVEESALELAESACPYVRPDGLEEQAVLVRVVAVCVTLVDVQVRENRRESGPLHEVVAACGGGMIDVRTC